MLLHSSFEPPEIRGVVLDIYSSEDGLAAIGLGRSGRETRERRLGRYFDVGKLYPAEGGHELYIRQLGEYFQGQRRVFELPLDLRGTPFQKSVWQAVYEIPFGRTVSYGQIAEIVGRPKGGRAVGAANHDNPIPIVVPCHRVIGADGSLTGFGGGLSLKRKLLALEGLLPPPAVQMRLF